jgi:hypothetical protein
MLEQHKKVAATSPSLRNLHLQVTVLPGFVVLNSEYELRSGTFELDKVNCCSSLV